MKPQEAKELVEQCGFNINGIKHATCEKIVISALEKQIPKKPIWDMGWVCPNCKHEEILHFPKRPDWNDLFCKHCGQALDWSDTE